MTSSATPPAVATLITGNEFRTRFEAKFRQGVLFGKIALQHHVVLGVYQEKQTGTRYPAPCGSSSVREHQLVEAATS